MKTIQTTYCERFDNSCYLQCTDDDNRSYRNVCNMSFVSFSLAVIFIVAHWIAFRYHAAHKQKGCLVQ